MKKILTLTLSLLMAFTLCLTVSADGDKGNEGDSSSTVTQEEKTVATIEGKSYTDLKTAITEVTDGQTIVLQDDMTIDTINVSGNKTITLDANGKTITQDFSSYNDASSYQRLIDVSNGAKLIIKGNGKFIGPTGSEYGVKYNAKSLIKVNGEGSKITIEDGEFTVTAGSDEKGMYGIFASNGATVELGVNGTNNGPKIHSFFAVVGQNNIASPSSTITIYGGNYTADVTKDEAKFCAAIFASATGSVSIYGGTFNGYYAISSPYANVTQNITISGGTFNATNSTKLALFVGNEKGSGETGTGTRTISITGGTFSSDVSEYLATGYNVVQKDGSYQVVKNDEKVEVKDTTAAVSDDARATINKATDIKDDKGQTVTVTASTQIKLESSKKELTTEETTKVESAKTDVVKKLKIDTTKEEIKTIPLDITLTAINGDQSTKITDLGDNNAITVTLYLNDATANALKGKTVKVIRIHDDKTDVLDATLTNNTLTFKTSKFSTYVLAYAETKPEEAKQETVSTKSYDPKDKNHDGVISCAEEMNSTNWTWSETKKACVYRVTNTSAK